MEDERVELVRGIYERWAEGDFKTADAFHPDMEAVWDKLMPEMSVDRGFDSFAATFRQALESLRDFKISARQIDLVNDKVIVLADVTGEGRESGAPFIMRAAHVWEIENGRARRLVGYIDEREALDAVRRA